MNIPHIERMIRLLHSIDQQNLPFSTSVWLAVERRRWTQVMRRQPARPVGCALGYAALVPDFQAAGLTLRVLPDQSAAYRPTETLPVAHTAEEFLVLARKSAEPSGLVEFNGETGFSAGAALFDVSRYRAEHWFGGQHYVTAIHIAVTMQMWLNRQDHLRRYPPVWLTDQPSPLALKLGLS